MSIRERAGLTTRANGGMIVMTHLISVAIASAAMAGLSAMTPMATHASSSSSTILVAQQPSDDTLKDRIEYRLETNSLVRKYHVDVKVTDGVAMLSGDVATAAQKAEAERLAKIDGGKRVGSTTQDDAHPPQN